jgi:glycosyltransferase involved in cell wall biosynthesis
MPFIAHPTVSIITPAFRRLTYLKLAIESALAQSFRDFELIVADDSNSEEIRRLCAGFADERIRYIARERNLGIALNNRQAMREARGRFIATLDDDDLWEPDFLSVMVPILEKHAAVCVAFCDHWIVDSVGSVDREGTDRNTRLWARDKLQEGILRDFLGAVVRDGSVPVAMAAVIRKDALDLDRFPAEVGGAYDGWLANQLAASGRQAYFVRQRLTRYRVHPGAASATRALSNFTERLFITETQLADPICTPLKSDLRRRAATLRFKRGQALMNVGRLHEARNEFRRSMTMRATWKPALLLGLCWVRAITGRETSCRG